MAWINPITNRTKSDVDQAAALKRRIQKDGWDSLTPEEKLSWLAGLKGAYNASDLNRVGECVQYLADLLIGYGYNVTVEAKTDWAMEDLPTATMMETYLNNVKALVDVYYTLPDTPEPPESMNKLYWWGANDIERVLVDIKEIIGKMKRSFKPCGTFVCGQGMFLPTITVYTTHAELQEYTHAELSQFTYGQIRIGGI